MNKINPLEKIAVLWHDNSCFALKLREELEDKGYDLKIILSGSEKPIFSTPYSFLVGYENILRFS